LPPDGGDKTGRAVARDRHQTNQERKQKMNPRKLMVVALCAAACVTTTAFAEDDFGIESASPVKIADPVNPQPGMVFNAYNYPNWMREAELKESNSKLPKTAALKTGIDKGEKFSLEISKGVDAAAIRWEGFLKCIRAATYTFLFQKKDEYWSCGYSIRINGQPVIPAAMREASCDVDLKVGWNKIEIVSQFQEKRDPLNVSFKPKGSLSEPRPIAPKDLFHDDQPDQPW